MGPSADPNTDANRRIATGVGNELILQKCHSFVDFQLWPTPAVLHSERWLSNFDPADSEHAHHLLNSFLFYSEPLVKQLFIAAFQNLSTVIRPRLADFRQASTAWENFCQRLLVTYVTGSVPNPTDSGLTFARMARQVLEIPEERILSPEDTLRHLLINPDSTIVFVDDFVGSGEQFTQTWLRPYYLEQRLVRSFAELAAKGGHYFYCPAICTARGLEEIEKVCSSRVTVSPANFLPDEVSPVHHRSVAWPNHLQASGPNFVERISKNAGIPDTDGNGLDWRGYRKLGLSLAFYHSVPDATLPIFYWEQNGWKPLIRRR